MSRVRDVAFASAAFALGAFWLASAGLKIAGPLESYEMLTRIAPPGLAAKTMFVAGVTVEALLGALLVLRVGSPLRALGFSLAWVAALAAVSLHVLASPLPPTSCGCLGAGLNVTPRQELALLAGLSAFLVTLIGWGLFFGPHEDPPSA